MKSPAIRLFSLLTTVIGKRDTPSSTFLFPYYIDIRNSFPIFHFFTIVTTAIVRKRYLYSKISFFCTTAVVRKRYHCFYFLTSFNYSGIETRCPDSHASRTSTTPVVNEDYVYSEISLFHYKGSRQVTLVSPFPFSYTNWQ